MRTFPSSHHWQLYYQLKPLHFTHFVGSSPALTLESALAKAVERPPVDVASVDENAVPPFDDAEDEPDCTKAP